MNSNYKYFIKFYFLKGNYEKTKTFYYYDIFDIEYDLKYDLKIFLESCSYYVIDICK